MRGWPLFDPNGTFSDMVESKTKMHRVLDFDTKLDFKSTLGTPDSNFETKRLISMSCSKFQIHTLISKPRHSLFRISSTNSESTCSELGSTHVQGVLLTRNKCHSVRSPQAALQATPQATLLRTSC
jgi:hypothetical protein